MSAAGRLLGGLLLLGLSAVANGTHITDKLVAGLYPLADSSAEPVKLLPSGTPLEVVRRASGFVEVRLADGTRGWVESAYVTDEKPARALLLEAQARIVELRQQIAAQSAAVSAESERERLQQALGVAEQRVAELEARTAASGGVWRWLLPLLTLVVGFFAGGVFAAPSQRSTE